MPARFTINEKQYKSPTWNEIKHSRFIEYLDTIPTETPVCLTNFIQSHYKAIAGMKETLSEKEKELEGERLFYGRWNKLKPMDKKACYEYFALEVSFWCGVDIELLREAMDMDVLFTVFWLLYFEMNPDNANANEDFVGFEIDGVLFVPPTKHMKESTLAEFADSAHFQESMQDLEAGNWRAMADIMAILCRPKGEPYSYSEKMHNIRRKKMLNVTMDNVINVAFFLLRLSKKLSQDLQIYIAEAVLLQKDWQNIDRLMDGQA